MIKRRVLFKRKTGQSKKVIGVVGVHGGAGVTYTSLMLALFMGEYLGKRTAFIEHNNHREMEIIEEVYQWNKLDNGSFNFNQIDCYKSLQKNQMISVLSKGYEVYIIDFGMGLTGILDEFLRCDIKLVLCSHGKWKEKKLVDFIQRYKDEKASKDWTILIPNGKGKVIKNLERRLERKIYGVPIEDDPTMLSKKTLQNFNKLLSLNIL